MWDIGLIVNWYTKAQYFVGITISWVNDPELYAKVS